VWWIVGSHTSPLHCKCLNTTSYLPFHCVSSPWTLHHIYHSTLFHLPEHYIIFTIPLCFISLNTTSYLPFHCVSSPWTLHHIYHSTVFHLPEHLTSTNHICVVMVCMLASSAIDLDLSSGRVKPRTIKLVFVASPLSTQH
jgi:hypothetical protein